MDKIESRLTFEAVNSLIDELETQFGPERMLPTMANPDGDCSFTCTGQGNCCGSSKTQ